jgi:membrane protease YdiL (CAAX protease family)
MGQPHVPGACGAYRAQCPTRTRSSSFLAFFEEIGWRAWLLPRLRERIARRAVVVTAAIWALWHVPFQLSGILHIDGVSPLNLVLTLPLGTVAAGLILGWIWLRTQSIWLVSIAHGALNDWGQYAFKYMKETGEPQTDLLLSAGSLALLIVGALLWRDADVSPVCKTTSGGERS